jgi:heptosyltransferase-1
MLYTRKVLTTDRAHVVEQALEMTRSIAPSLMTESDFDLPVDPEAEIRIASFTGDLKTGELKKFAILNPGAGWGAKRWPPERYGALARNLAQDGLTSLVNYGPGEDELAEAVENASDGVARRVTCSISELIALTRRAAIFIGGDTGPLHLAAALKIPVVAIFGPTNPARNGPFGTRSVVLRSANSVTDHSRHLEPEQGLLEITVDEVVAATRRLLQSSHNGAPYPAPPDLAESGD